MKEVLGLLFLFTKKEKILLFLLISLTLVLQITIENIVLSKLVSLDLDLPSSHF